MKKKRKRDDGEEAVLSNGDHNNNHDDSAPSKKSKKAKKEKKGKKEKKEKKETKKEEETQLTSPAPNLQKTTTNDNGRKVENKPFKRVDESEVVVDPRLSDNSFSSKASLPPPPRNS